MALDVARQDDPAAVSRAVTVSREERVALLRGVPALMPLPSEVLDRVAPFLAEECFTPGQAVLIEGEIGDRLYLIARGQAEATTASSNGPVVLEGYGPGEVFGELALLTPEHVRRATVTAVTDLLTLSLEALAFERLLADHPEARATFEEMDEYLLVVKFLKAASPFARLDLDRIRRLAERLQPLRVDVGKDVVRQGEQGDACYLLRTGHVVVLAQASTGEAREVAELGPGSVIGEAALLTDAPRNATVRATEPCELLTLRRADLLAEVGSDQELGHELVELIQLRDRPKQTPGIIVGHRTTADGTTITTLKDPRRAVYYRLSPEGYFVWQRLDGDHTLRDVTLEYMMQFKSFAPSAIADAIQGLTVAGFVERRSLREEVADTEGRMLSGRQRFTAMAGRAIDWQVSLPNPDRWLSTLYRGGVWLLFTRPAQILLALLGLIGFGVFVGNLGRAAHATSSGGWVLLLFFALYLLMVVLHEFGHAFSVKFFGREVPRAGVGWYWFGPVAYADTSDMWLAGRRPRIVVTLGGLYASFLVGGASAIGAVLLSGSVVAAMLWQLAFLSYYAVLVNLNPLMELDGYFLLMDYLDRPNLRAHCLAWLGRELPQALRDRRVLAGHKLELFYGVAAVGYVFFLGYSLLIVFRTVVQGWLSHVIPFVAAATVAWSAMAALVALTLVTLVGELRASRQAVPSR